MTTTRTSGPERAPRTLAMMAVAALTMGGCASDESESGGTPQVIEGRVALARLGGDVKGVRAVADGRMVASSRVRGDGHFTLSVPVARGIRLEVVTEDGTRGFVGTTGSAPEGIEFDVCGGGEPFDVGDVGPWDGQDGGEDGMDPDGTGDGDVMDPDGDGHPDDCGEPEPEPEPCPDGEMCDPCLEDPSLCEVQCDDQGNCCWGDGTCCYADGTCCFADGTCTEPCDEKDPNSECYCNEQDPASYCYCDEQDPASYCYCSADDPMSWCYEWPPCDPETGENCCAQGYDDPSCWPEPEPDPCSTDDQDPDMSCWSDGVEPDVEIPDFGCDEGGWRTDG